MEKFLLFISRIKRITLIHFVDEKQRISLSVLAYICNYLA